MTRPPSPSNHLLGSQYQWADHEDLPPIRSFWNFSHLTSSLAYNARLIRTLIVAAHAYKRHGHSREYFWRASYQQMTHIRRAGAHIEIEGLEHLRAMNGQPVVFIGNHMSLLETFIMPCILLSFYDPIYVVKESLKNMPFLGIILQKQDAIAVGRSNPRDDLKAVMTQGQEQLAKGKPIVIFPQSTRKVAFDVHNFNTIGVKLAAKANVPIIPLALRTDFLQNGKIVKDLGAINPEKPTIHFAFGEPIPPTVSSKEAHEQVIQFIENHLREWGVPIEASAQNQ